jgi:hypothetical protein
MMTMMIVGMSWVKDRGLVQRRPKRITRGCDDDRRRRTLNYFFNKHSAREDENANESER